MTYTSTFSLWGIFLIWRAEMFARYAHWSVGHKRKYTNQPYSTHLAEVALTVARTSNPSYEQIAVAWLHDTLEDVPWVSERLLRFLFGDIVTVGVIALTDVYTNRTYAGVNREERKRREAYRLGGIYRDWQTVKYADLISNASTIIALNTGFSRIYLKEIQAMLTKMQDGDPALRRHCQALVELGVIYLNGKEIQ